MTLRCAALALLCLATAPSIAAAQADLSAEPAISTQSPTATGRPGVMFTLRGGVASDPEYLGSDENVLGPDFGFRFNFANLPGGRQIGNPDPWADSLGFGVHGSLRYLGERDSDDYDDLDGLDDIDAALELGAGIGYTAQNFSAFADMRRGFGGHEGWVLSAGADLIARPNDRLRLNVGPRLLWGDETYTDTYFGVDTAAPGRPLYDADGGLVSAGVEFGARYQLSDSWGIEGAITYDSLQNDAADSPLVKDLGESDQWGVRIGVTRVIQLGF